MTKSTVSEIQLLEERRLMAAVPLVSSTSTFGTGTQLKISGTSAADNITLSFDGAKYNLKTSTGYSQSFTGKYNSIRVYGGKGNDAISIHSSVKIPTYLYGDDGNDTLRGGSGDDFIYGGAGNDDIGGNAGRDTLITLGGGTVDIAAGGAGNDFFWLDTNTTEKALDATSTETASRSVNRVSAFETSKFVTGTTKTQAISKELTVTPPSFRDPDVSNKAYVYKKFNNNPLFAAGGPKMDDVKQGQIGDCYFLATLAGAADVSPTTIQSMMTDLGDGTYAVRFNNTAGQAKFYRVDSDLAVYDGASTTPAYAKLGVSNSLWVAIAEKAFTYHRRGQGTYNSINGGWMTEAFSAIGAKSPATQWREDAGSAKVFLSWVEKQLNAGNVVTLGVMSDNDTLNLVGGHAYTVDRVETLANGTKQLILRNPWAVDGYRTSDNANDGYLRLSAQEAYAGIDVFVGARAA